MANKYLEQFTPKTTPVGADILYLGDSEASPVGDERKTTITQLITNNAIVTVSGSPTAGDLVVIGAGNQVKDAGIAVDSSQNVTGINTLTLSGAITGSTQAATKAYADTKLAIASNLSDLNNAATARTNLGLGTSALKTASSNSFTNVASVNGATTVGHVAVFSDTAGTVEDGGSSGQFFLVSNNLSEGTPLTMRTNLGLGTAAVKAASGVGGTVASVTGSFTAGHIATFADTSGTIQDGGTLTGFFAIANNLSEGTPSVMRTNLGLGTAAVKNATGSGTNVASVTGTFTAGHIATFADTSGTIQDGGTVAGFFLIANNLSEGTPSTMRTNLGLGTAAVKNASGSGSTVASVTGSFTVGHLASFADTSGTIQDGGTTAGFLLAANNLTDVASKTIAFDNISPLTTKGDLIGYDGSNDVRIAGSSTNNYVLTYDSTQATGIKWAPVPTPGEVVRVINTTTILTSADFGKTILCQGSSSYTVTLPAASSLANSSLYFVIDTTSNALVTIAGAGGDTISGQSSIVLGVYDGVTLMTNGSRYLIADSSLYPVTLQAYSSTQQTVTSSAVIILAIDTDIYDKGNSLNSLTNTVQPLWPGKYEIYYQFELVAPSTTCFYQTKILLNGTTASTSFTSLNGLVPLGGFGPATLSYTNFCNGSTDSFVFTAAQQSTGAVSQLVNNNSLITYIEMKRISLF